MVPVVKLAEQVPPVQLLMPAGEEEIDPPVETFTVNVLLEELLLPK
jgi:hypothetical protein